MSLLAHILQRLARGTPSRPPAPDARPPASTLKSASIYQSKPQSTPAHPDTELVMATWRTYREQRPDLSWSAFIRALEASRRTEAQSRARYESELAALQQYTRFKQ